MPRMKGRDLRGWWNLAKLKVAPIITTIDHIHFKRGSRGWLCELCFRVDVRTQCTMQDVWVRGIGSYGRGLRGIFSSLYWAYRAARQAKRELQAVEGPWEIVA